MLLAFKDHDPHEFAQYQKMKELIENFLHLDPGDQEQKLIGNL